MEALAALLHNKWRTFLTLLGMIIGAGSLVLLSGLLAGGKEALRATSQELTEADVITVNHSDVSPAQGARTQRLLDSSDLTALTGTRELGLSAGTGVLQAFNRVAWFQGRQQKVMLSGASSPLLGMYRLRVLKGRFLDETDLTERSRVCVVGFGVWQELLQGAADLSRATLTLSGVAYQVIGVLEHKPILGKDALLGMTWDGRVVVPVTTLQSVVRGSRRLDRILVRASLPAESVLAALEPVRSMTRALLLRRHHGVENFRIDPARGAKQQEEAIFLVINILMLCTAGLSMIVGGINIMNIMLVTVGERTREIGVRRALGATRGDILRQFLFESALLAGIGGLLGVAGGMVLTYVTSKGLAAYLGAWMARYEPGAILLGMTSTTVFGLLFGLYPAWRAARLDPVLALRYE